MWSEIHTGYKRMHIKEFLGKKLRLLIMSLSNFLKICWKQPPNTYDESNLPIPMMKATSQYLWKPFTRNLIPPNTYENHLPGTLYLPIPMKTIYQEPYFCTIFRKKRIEIHNRDYKYLLSKKCKSKNKGDWSFVNLDWFFIANRKRFWFYIRLQCAIFVFIHKLL